MSRFLAISNMPKTRPSRFPSPPSSQVTGWPLGCWRAELSHAWSGFNHAGFDIPITSPDRGAIEWGGFSDAGHESRYSANDCVSQGFKTAVTTKDLIKKTVEWAQTN